MNPNKKQKSRSPILGFFTVVLFLGGNVWAEDPLLIHLEDLIQRARETNPELIAAKADWLAAKKRIWIDSSLPDPMGGFDLMGPMTETRVGPQENRFVVEQEVPFPLKLWEKGKIANDEARASYQRYLAVERDVVNELTKAYAELYYIDASVESIEEIKGLLKKAEGAAQARYSNLSGTQRDVAKAQAEVSMSLEKLIELKHHRQNLEAKINALLDQDPIKSIGKTAPPAKPVLNETLIELINLAVKNRQEIKEMEAMVSKSKHAKKLSKLNFIPDIKVGFEYTDVGSGTTTDPDDGRNSWMFPLRINLPIWANKNIPEVQEAQKRIEASEARLREAKNTTFYEVKVAYHSYQLATENMKLYESAIILQAQLALSSDQAGYEAGNSDFLNLLDSERVYLNAKLTYIRLFFDALQSHADLVRATGLDFETAEPSADRTPGVSPHPGGGSEEKKS